MKEENALVKLVYQMHENIKENLVILNDALNFVKTDGFWKAKEEIFSFFNDHLVVHFRNEEIIFDVAKRHNQMEDKEYQMIEEVVGEHKVLLARYGQLKYIISNDTLTAEDKKNKFIDEFRSIIKVVVKHAEKEDNMLFPILERYMDERQLVEADRIIKAKGALK